MPGTSTTDELPDSATGLIALARAAHRDGHKKLEQAAAEKLAREYGMRVTFVCCDAVDADVAAGSRPRNRNRGRRAEGVAS